MARAPRTERLQAMVTEHERKILERVAARREMTVSEYLRGAGLVLAAVDGEPEGLRLIGHGIVQAVREWTGAPTRRAATG